MGGQRGTISAGGQREPYKEALGGSVLYFVRSVRSYYGQSWAFQTPSNILECVLKVDTASHERSNGSKWLPASSVREARLGNKVLQAATVASGVVRKRGPIGKQGATRNKKLK